MTDHSLDKPASPPPPPSTSTSGPPAIYTYHCLCSTHLLTTPYALSDLQQRASPSLDHARILPFPSASPPSVDEQDDQDGKDVEDGQQRPSIILPSLLSTNVKPVKKPIVVQREDGWEKRRLWRCGRCGLAVVYEVLGDEEPAEKMAGDHEKGDGVGKVLFLLEEGLVETGKWDG